MSTTENIEVIEHTNPISMKKPNMKEKTHKTEDDRLFEALARRLSPAHRAALVALAEKRISVNDETVFAALRREDCIDEDGDLTARGHNVVPFLPGAEPT